MCITRKNYDEEAGYQQLTPGEKLVMDNELSDERTTWKVLLGLLISINVLACTPLVIAAASQAPLELCQWFLIALIPVMSGLEIGCLLLHKHFTFRLHDLTKRQQARRLLYYLWFFFDFISMGVCSTLLFVLGERYRVVGVFSLLFRISLFFVIFSLLTQPKFPPLVINKEKKPKK